MSLRDITPSLAINGVIVHFKSFEDHSNYVAFEERATYQERRDYAAAFGKENRAEAKRKLNEARARAYNDWLTKRGKV